MPMVKGQDGTHLHVKSAGSGRPVVLIHGWPLIDCVDAFGRTDFRPDLPASTVPTLVIHGTGDKTVPIDATGRAAARAIPQ